MARTTSLGKAAALASSLSLAAGFVVYRVVSARETAPPRVTPAEGTEPIEPHVYFGGSKSEAVIRVSGEPDATTDDGSPVFLGGSKSKAVFGPEDGRVPPSPAPPPATPEPPPDPPPDPPPEYMPGSKSMIGFPRRRPPPETPTPPREPAAPQR